MKEIYKVEKIGFSETQLVEDDVLCEKPWTDIHPPQPCWKPKFSFRTNEWTETATEEEMNPPFENEQTEKDRVESLENTVLELADLILSGGETNVK
ncbi:hypothetical protein AB6834_02710 [Carnobacterium divergens]|uniref:hypothetical protein n=1 Tax=Carnobacterium divergens TaxID=2748 RepID=UPI0039BDACD0